MTLDIPARPHNEIVQNQYTDTKIPYNLQKRYRSSKGSLQ